MLPDPRLFLRSVNLLRVVLYSLVVVVLVSTGLVWAQTAQPAVEPEVALGWLREAAHAGRWVAAVTAGIAVVFGLLFYVGATVHPFFARSDVRMYLVIAVGVASSVWESVRTKDVVTWQIVLVASASGLADWIQRTRGLLNSKKEKSNGR